MKGNTNPYPVEVTEENAEAELPRYAAWLKEQYGAEIVEKFPPFSVITVEGLEGEQLVAGYARWNERPTVTVISMSLKGKLSYEQVCATAEAICPEHVLPTAALLRNENGEDFAAIFRG